MMDEGKGEGEDEGAGKGKVKGNGKGKGKGKINGKDKGVTLIVCIHDSAQLSGEKTKYHALNLCVCW